MSTVKIRSVNRLLPLYPKKDCRKHIQSARPVRGFSSATSLTRSLIEGSAQARRKSPPVYSGDHPSASKYKRESPSIAVVPPTGRSQDQRTSTGDRISHDPKEARFETIEIIGRTRCEAH